MEKLPAACEMITDQQILELDGRIRRAFPPKQFEYAVGPKPGRRREAPSFLGQNWWVVPLEVAAREIYFSFNFTAPEATYYCPLLLLSCLHTECKGHDDYFDRFFYLMDEGTDDSAWFSLDPDGPRRLNKEIIALRESFDVDQKHAIAAFFAYRASQRDEGAERALDDYWSRYLDGDKG